MTEATKAGVFNRLNWERLEPTNGGGESRPKYSIVSSTSP